MSKVQAMWEINDNGVRYFKREDGRIYFPNRSDPRPSRQFYAWTVSMADEVQTRLWECVL